MSYDEGKYEEPAAQCDECNGVIRDGEEVNCADCFKGAKKEYYDSGYEEGRVAGLVERRN